jgi:endonuclease/exonuclease/phosphatase family metal-dependent hydrolase
MSKRSKRWDTELLRARPAWAGLLVVFTTVLGWIGCESMSHVADRTADLVQQAQIAGNQAATTTGAGQTSGSASTSVPAQNAGFAQAPSAPASGGLGAAGPAQTSGTQPADAFISIGSFNIQVFGRDKIGDPTVMSYLVDIARKFDVLAIQELRSTDDSIIPQFVQMINQGGHLYGYVVGPREGYTNSKEQYVFIYNERKVERVDQGTVVRHPRRLLHRDPLCATFRCRTAVPQAGFSFTLMNIHTDPDVVASEMDALADIWNLARQTFPYEDDLILLGDLNAAPREFRGLGQVPGLFAVIPDEMTTNTARTKCYDNIVFNRQATLEYLGRFGVFDVASFYRLTPEQARVISDHLPVWGLFSIYEQGAGSVAGQPGGFR